MTAFDTFRQVAAACQGYMIERMWSGQIEEADALDIGLRWGPDKPDITLSFRDVYHLEFSRLPGTDPGPLNEVTATVLEPANEPWPPGLAPVLMRSPELPPLLWFRATGLIHLSVLAPIATAYVETR